MYIYCTKGEKFIMKIKKLSILLAVVLFITVFCMMGCANSSQAPEAFAVSIYKVEKVQDVDGNVYITNYALWKSYNVTPTQAIDLPDYNPEMERNDCKVLYEDGYSYDGDISGNVSSTVRPSGYFFACKNKIQFIPYGNSIIFARERQKKTINFFYEGKNITESLSAMQIEKFNKIFKDTYAESFSLESLAEFISIKHDNGRYKRVSLYTKENGEKAFFENYYYGYGGYNGGTFTLIKSTNIYLRIEEKENESNLNNILHEERLARESGYTSAG